MKVFAALGAAVLPLVAAKVSYEGYKAFHIDSHDDYAGVEKAISKLDFVSLSCESDRKGLDVAVAPESVKAFEALGLDTTVITHDIGADISTETFTQYKRTVRRDGNGTLAVPDLSYFDSYHTFEEHLQFLEDLQAAFPDNSEIFVAGDSLEGRPIQGIHLWGADGPGKKAVIYHGTVHAREWIVAPTVEYIAWKLITEYQVATALITTTLDTYDFYIMPVVNPDGFVYTQTEDRLWRKNRQVRDGETCVGTDVNRNWPYQWDVEGGSSPDHCSETFRGEAPGDTPEMMVMTNHTLGLSETTGIKFFIDVHAFSQLILLPYGYTCDKTPENIDQQMKLAGGVAAAIKGVNDLDFVYGPTCETIYQAAGSSMDFVYDVAGAEIAWATELRPASGGNNGFILTADNIIPSGEENWAGQEFLYANW